MVAAIAPRSAFKPSTARNESAPAESRPVEATRASEEMARDAVANTDATHEASVVADNRLLRAGPRATVPNGGVDTAGLRRSLEASMPTLRQGEQGSAVADMQRRLTDRGYDLGDVDGKFGPKTRSAVRAFQSDQGLKVDGIVGKNTWGALGPSSATPAVAPPGAQPAAPAAPATSTGDGRLAGLPYQANATALQRAKNTSAGRRIGQQTPEHAATYKRASELTGVPAEIIGAIHANESGQGTYRPSTHGPESGYGLDDRWVSTRWGNQKLAKHGLGRWQRGRDTATGRLQSAVVAAEHFKRQAGNHGIEVGPNMSKQDLVTSVTAYTSSNRLVRRAKQSGKSWMFNPSDSNPHPLHPGGTSRGRGGRTIRVAPSRKPGLLRWDVLIPMMRDQLATTVPNS
jgi:peptidoglycan hydrolase-like protein with peptidoglycan-binding domain